MPSGGLEELPCVRSTPKAVLSLHKVGQPFVIGRQIEIALTQLMIRGGGSPFAETKRDRAIVLCTAG